MCVGRHCLNIYFEAVSLACYIVGRMRLPEMFLCGTPLFRYTLDHLLAIDHTAGLLLFYGYISYL